MLPGTSPSWHLVTSHAPFELSCFTCTFFLPHEPVRVIRFSTVACVPCLSHVGAHCGRYAYDDSPSHSSTSPSLSLSILFTACSDFPLKLPDCAIQHIDLR